MNIEENNANSHFGFRKRLDTREALFSIQVLVQICETFTGVRNLENISDKLQHIKMVKILLFKTMDNVEK